MKMESDHSLMSCACSRTIGSKQSVEHVLSYPRTLGSSMTKGSRFKKENRLVDHSEDNEAFHNAEYMDD